MSGTQLKLKKLGMIMMLGRFAQAVSEAGGNVASAAIQLYARAVADDKSVSNQIKAGGIPFTERVRMMEFYDKAFEIMEALGWEQNPVDCHQNMKAVGSGST